MKQRLLLFLMAICVLLAGCVSTPFASPTQAPQGTTAGTQAPQAIFQMPSVPILPEVPADYFAILCENSEITISGQSFMRDIRYQILSASPLAGETLEVSFDQQVPFCVFVEMAEEPSIMDAVSFAAYQGLSWAECARDAGNAAFSAYREWRESAPEEEQPKLYTGVLLIRFEEGAFAQDTVLHTMQVTVGGKAYTYELDNVRLVPQLFEKQEGDGLWNREAAESDRNLDVGSEGGFSCGPMILTAQEDVTLDGLRFTNGSQVYKVQYTQTLPDGQMVDTLWDISQPLELAAGEEVTFSVEGRQDSLADSLQATRQFALLIDYTNRATGEQGVSYTELSYRRRCEPFQTYAQLEDGLDILSYYTVYLAAGEP